MTKDQAQQAVALIGGLAATSRRVLNAGGQPISGPNLSKAINAPRGVPDWLSEQLYSLVCRHAEVCEQWAMDAATNNTLD